MIKYGREDVHYLLYIYDRMRQDLVKYATTQGLEPSQFLKSVLKKSCDVCLQTYVKPKLKDESYYNLVLRNKIVLSTSKVKTLKNLLKWRFKHAALEDENPNFVLSNSLIFQLIEKNPKTTKELHLNFKKLGPIAKKLDNELIDLINDNSKEELPQFVTVQQSEKKNYSPPKITQSTSFLSVPINEKQLDPKFQIAKTTIIIPQYKGNFLYQNEKKINLVKEKKISEIKKSFNYENYIEYILDVHPEIKPLFNEAKEIQNADINRLKALEDNKLESIENLEGRGTHKKDFDFIGFSIEKGEHPTLKKKEISLNVDQEKIMNELEKIKEIPKSFKEQYGTSLKDKKKNKRNFKEIENNEKDNNVTKKIKKDEKNGNFNKFAVLNQKDNSESESEKDRKQKKKKIITEDDFKEISQKIMSDFFTFYILYLYVNIFKIKSIIHRKKPMGLMF